MTDDESLRKMYPAEYIEYCELKEDSKIDVKKGQGQPLHGLLLQALNSEGFPWQNPPPPAGAGESHCLERDLEPPPQL